MPTVKRFFVTLLLLVRLTSTHSQIYNFERYSLPEGLSQSQVFDIKQDTLGRIWLATERGGITILSGEHPTYLGRNDGLPGKATYSIFYDKKHRMWLGTNRGVVFYNGKSLQKPLGHQLLDTLSIWSITQRTDQTIVFATNDGVYGYTDSLGCFLMIPELKGNPISKVAARTNNLVYIMAYQQPLLLYNGHSLEEVMLPLKQGTNIEVVFFDNKDQIYVGTTHGLITREEYFYKTLTTADGLSDDHILSITEDKYGNIWVGTDEGGINVIMPDTILTIRAHQGIGNNRINALYYDNYQNLWVGTDGAGAYVFKGFRFKKLELPEFVETVSVTAIEIKQGNKLYIGTGGYGVLSISGKKRKLFNQQNGLRGNFVNAIETISKQETYIGTNQGITILSDNRIDFEKTIELDINYPVSVIRKAPSGEIWIGTTGHGVYMVSNGTKKRYTIRSGLLSNNIADIAIDQFKQVYIATDRGISVISGKNIHNLTVESGILCNNIISLTLDKNNNLWVISELGLTKIIAGKIINRPQASFTESQILYSVTSAPNGYVVVGTERGIIVFFIDERSRIRQIKEYTREDGFFGMECNPKAIAIDQYGDFYFGTKQGVTIFDPTADSIPNPMPNAYIRNVDLLYKKANWMNFSDSILQWSLLPFNPTFPYYENNLSFSFAANDFQFSSKLMFQFYLHGYDKTWLTPTRERTVNYTNLPPGKYEMRVRSWYPPNTASTIYSSFTFTIDKPFFTSFWFIALSFFSLTSLVVLIWNWRFHIIRANERRLEALVRERTADIERQKIQLMEANVKISQNAQLKEQFLANTSHEIRTPLNVISGYANLLLNTQLDKQQQKYLHYIKESSDNLKVIVNDILDFSKMEAGKLEIDSIPFDFIRTIRTTTNHLEIEAAKQGLTLELVFKNISHNVIEGDPVRLTQILSNLVRNAIKFTPSGSIVVYCTDISDNPEKILLKMEITDTGIGIPQEKLDTIFDSFTQVSNETTRKYGGTGLGLAIVKRLVDKMNGTITVESTVGVGSKFTVVLPFTKSYTNPTETNQSDHTIIPHTLSKEVTILLVDDNEINVALAENTLKSFSTQFHIQTAYNGLQAIDLASRNLYDLIIMDIQMPEMDGYSATEIIRNKLPEPNRSIPILGMTAHAMREEREKCLSYGMSEYISKPFAPRALFEMVLALTGTTAKKITDPPKVEAESMPSFALIDPQQLWKNSGGKTNRFVRYLQMYSESIPKQINDLEQCLDNLKEGDVKILAHTLKTSFRYLGIKQAAALAYEIEKAYTNGGYVDHKKCLDEIKAIWQEIGVEVEKYLNNFSK